MESRDWSMLPHHILVNIFSYMSRADQSRSARVCKSWNDIFNSPYLWTYFNFWFYMPSQEKYTKCLDKFGKYLRHVFIELDQSVEANRSNACKVIEGLAALNERRLKSLKIRFTGENPYFYTGKEFIEALSLLLGQKENCKIIQVLKELDLGGLMVPFDDKLINLISANHQEIEILKIQNRVLVCKVTPESIVRLIQKCRKLKDLRLYNCSLSEDVLLALTEGDREPLEHLSVVCRREEKYGKDIGSDTWQAVVNKLPNLRVSLGFDHTVELHKVSMVMKPEIPVSVLKLETFTYIYSEVRLATRYYSKTLEKLVLQTPLSRNSPELNKALIELAEQCTNLRSMHVFCVLDEPTVNKILEVRPELKEKDSYTLKYVDEPHPWQAGYDCFHN